MISNVYRPKRMRNGKRIVSRMYRGRYRLKNEIQVTEIPLYTSDKQVAKERLRKITDEIQQEGAGIIAPKALRNAAQKSLIDHLSDFIADLTAKGRDKMYVYNIEKRAKRVFGECGWKIPADVTTDSFIAWRARQKKAPKTINEYLDTMEGLLNWMQRLGRLIANPLRSVGKVQTQGREERKRRALTDYELNRLLSCVSKERKALYLTAVFTGLRKAELAALLWGDIFIDGEKFYLRVRASTTKNHKDATIRLHKDAMSALNAIAPANMDKSAKVFGKLPRMDQFREDLKRAGIQYKDSQGRQADFHALRHTFSTNLARAGVNSRFAMELMRHSDMRLTQKTYTDALQLPTSAAIESLPSILEFDPQLHPQKLGAGRHLVAQAVNVEDSDNAAEEAENKWQSHDLALVGAGCQKSQVVAGLGFEPRQTDSESAVLPLHHPAMDEPDVFRNRQKLL